jgi:DNA-binding transcriptional MocR family regulator
MVNDNSELRVTQALRAELARQPPGALLPSVRALMARWKVSPVTVQRAVARLAAEGLVEARPGRGTFVARPAVADEVALHHDTEADMAWQSLALGEGRASAEALAELVTLPPSGAIPLSTGYLPPELQCTEALRVAMHRALRRPRIWDRLPQEGLEPLRDWFAGQLGGGYRAHDVLICPGSQSAIAAAFRGLTTPGAAVVVESPTYIGALTAARAAGLRLVPVPVDQHGVRPVALAEALATSGARVFYSQPTWSNPSGSLLSPERRAEVIECVRAAGAFLVEDDWARDLWLDHPPPPPLAAEECAGHVVYVRSLTKPAAAGLRVAALCARGAALARLRSTRIADDSFVAGPLQETALELVTAPAWRQHLKRMRGALRARREALVGAVTATLGTDALPLIPGGGFHLWVRLPNGAEVDEVVTRAARAGVVVSRGRRWFPAEPPAPYLRLTFAGASPDLLRRGVALLASALRRPKGGRKDGATGSA